MAPIFGKYCLSCHGHDDPDGGLVLERHSTLLKGGESGAAILSGKSSGSLLVRLIESSAKEVMPPGKRKKLTADEIATIKKWIDAGAELAAFQEVSGSDVGCGRGKPRLVHQRHLAGL